MRGEPGGDVPPLGRGVARQDFPRGAGRLGAMAARDVGGGRPPRRFRRTGADRPPDGFGAYGHDPLRELDRPRPPHARRVHRRRTGGPGLRGVLAAEPGLRQAEIHIPRGPAGACLRRKRGDVLPRAQGAGSRRGRGRRQPRDGRGDTRHAVFLVPRGGPDVAGREDVHRGSPGIRRQGALHLRFDRPPEGGDQHPRDALLEPADAGADMAVHADHPARSGRLAPVEPHLRRKPQLQPRPQARGNPLHRRGQTGSRPRGADGQEPRGDLPDHLLQRPDRLRDAPPISREGREPAGQLLPTAAARLLRRGRPFAGPLAAPGSGFPAGHRKEGSR